jgi:hypothetical protein
MLSHHKAPMERNPFQRSVRPRGAPLLKLRCYLSFKGGQKSISRFKMCEGHRTVRGARPARRNRAASCSIAPLLYKDGEPLRLGGAHHVAF